MKVIRVRITGFPATTLDGRLYRPGEAVILPVEEAYRLVVFNNAIIEGKPFEHTMMLGFKAEAR